MATDYADLTKDELQAALSARGLPVSGNKPELVERLEEYDTDPSRGDEPSPETGEPEPEDEPEEEPGSADDYTRAGGHVLTDMGWVPEQDIERLGAKPTRI